MCHTPLLNTGTPVVEQMYLAHPLTVCRVRQTKECSNNLKSTCFSDVSRLVTIRKYVLLNYVGAPLVFIYFYHVWVKKFALKVKLFTPLSSLFPQRWACSAHLRYPIRCCCESCATPMWSRRSSSTKVTSVRPITTSTRGASLSTTSFSSCRYTVIQGWAFCGCLLLQCGWNGRSLCKSCSSCCLIRSGSF